MSSILSMTSDGGAIFAADDGRELLRIAPAELRAVGERLIAFAGEHERRLLRIAPAELRAMGERLIAFAGEHERRRGDEPRQE